MRRSMHSIYIVYPLIYAIFVGADLVEDRIARDIRREFVDLYNWKHLKDETSGNSCFPIQAGDSVSWSVDEVRDSFCVAACPAHPNGPSSTGGNNARCRSGFPFYRFSRGIEDCIDCLDVQMCQARCLSKGLDVAALINDDSHILAECRCGATMQNTDIWRDLKGSEGEPVDFSSITYLLPPDPSTALPPSDPSCRISAWIYGDTREKDGSPPIAVVAGTTDDSDYVRGVVIGMYAMPDEEDSLSKSQDMLISEALADRVSCSHTTAKEEEELSHAEDFESPAIIGSLSQRRHMKYAKVASGKSVEKQSSHQTAQVGNDDDVDTAGVPYSSKSEEGNECAGVDEPRSVCWDTVKTRYEDCKYGCSPELWETNFRDDFCTAEKKQVCPITCGTCRLYNRSPGSSGQFQRWEGMDEEAGLVRIPYVIDSEGFGTQPDYKDVVALATTAWLEKTCILFHEIDLKTASASSQPYIFISDQGSNPGCWAEAGRPFGKMARMNLGKCANYAKLGSVVHEFGHVLGFSHTHMRADRDDYIQINWENLIPGVEGNFNSQSYEFDGAAGKYDPYDFSSIMHYSRRQGLKSSLSNTNEGTFDLGQAAEPGVQVGQRIQLSEGDVDAANTMYECPSCRDRAPNCPVDKCTTLFAAGQQFAGLCDGTCNYCGVDTPTTTLPPPTPTPQALITSTIEPSSATTSIPSTAPSTVPSTALPSTPSTVPSTAPSTAPSSTTTSTIAPTTTSTIAPTTTSTIAPTTTLTAAPTPVSTTGPTTGPPSSPPPPPPQSTSAPPSTAAAVTPCTDRLAACYEYVFFCDSKFAPGGDKEGMCDKTCGFCGESSNTSDQPSPQPSSSSPQQPSPQQPPAEAPSLPSEGGQAASPYPSCQDRYPMCDKYVSLCGSEFGPGKVREGQCDRTCGYCDSQPATKTGPITHKPPSPRCHDLIDSCHEFTGLCHRQLKPDAEYGGVCDYTCGHCEPSSSDPPPTQTDCEDLLPSCSRYQHMCDTQLSPNQEYGGMCDYTCGFCRKSGAFSGPMMNKPKGVSECVDTIDNCSHYISLCAHDLAPGQKYAGTCDRSCGYCGVNAAVSSGHEQPTAQCQDQIASCNEYEPLCDTHLSPSGKYAGVCDFTCGYCHGEAPTVAPGTSAKNVGRRPTASCFDHLSTCTKYVPLCTTALGPSGKYPGQCDFTCGYCEGLSTASPAGGSGCTDDSSQCPQFADRCKDLFCPSCPMAAKCNFTCGLCPP